MGVEIERKFLVHKHLWDKEPKERKMYISQGYLTTTPELTVRVRLKEDKAYLTIKGKSTGATRAEFEYEIPVADARQLLNNFAQTRIEKNRYEITFAGKLWEVDEFYGDNEGLLLAELELQSETEPFEKPDWVGQEVTEDVRYYNSKLINNPYKNW